MLKEYKPPHESICEFLANAILKISKIEEGEGQALARRLIEVYDGKNKRQFHTNTICDAFPWMHQVGLLKYRYVYATKGGRRLMLTRAGTDEDATRALMLRPSVINEIVQWDEVEVSPTLQRMVTPAPKVPPALTSLDLSAADPKPKKKKKKKKCCDDPRPVRSKKTGKRKCKNCGKKLKDKKKKGNS